MKPSPVFKPELHQKLKFFCGLSTSCRDIQQKKNFDSQNVSIFDEIYAFICMVYIHFSPRGEACNRMFMSFPFRTRVIRFNLEFFFCLFGEINWLRVDFLRWLPSISIYPEMNLHFMQSLISNALVLNWIKYYNFWKPRNSPTNWKTHFVLVFS